MRFSNLSVLLSALLAACGGGASDAVGNPPSVKNPEVVAGQYLSFAYFQKCINPIFLAQLPAHGGGSTAINTCAGSGCHDTTTGTGGALRLVPSALPVDLANAANTAATVRLSDMYKNFYSAQGATVIGSTTQSRLLTKPLLMGVLHGGGLIFTSEQDPNAQLIKYWISHPMPTGQDEFSTAGNALFTPPDAATGTCNIQ
jgi:hypothetical protein